MNYEQVHDVIEKTLHFKSNMMAQDVKMFLDHYNKMIERDIMGIQNKEIIDLCRKIYRANKDAIDLICSCNNIKDVIIESIQDLYVNDLISLKKDGMFAVKSLKNNINLQKLQLTDNRVYSLHGLENLKQLNSLDLQNNCLQDIIQYTNENNETQTTRNLSIVKVLNNSNEGKLNTLLLSGNSNLTDFSEIKNLSWSSKNGF